jgi:DNA polymerase-4
LELPSSLGVATNKLVANAITVVAPGDEGAFLAPLPCDALWGVGPKTAVRLAEWGMRLIGDLARQAPEDMETLLGKTGRELVMRAQGIDDRPVVIERETKSISQETTFTRDVSNEDELLRTLHDLAQGVGRELRRNGLAASTVRLKMRWSDFTTPTRQTTLSQPNDDSDTIYTTAKQLFVRLWQPGQPVRLIGVGVSGLTDPPRQMGLFDVPNERVEKLSSAVSAVRARFGDGAIVRGSEMRRRKQTNAGKDDLG